jgi:DNA phosphorothioation-associated putative methyltransferase
LTELETQFGSLRRAFKLVQQATDAAEWDAIAEQRRQDLLVYLALSHFSHRPQFRDLSEPVQNDVRLLFGSYKHACTAADLMLLSLGNLEAITLRCRESAIGQQRPNSLWVHVSVLDQLDPLLRLYEGCASRTIGRPEEATLIKFHFSSPKVSYLMVPEFDKVPHPTIRTRMQISLRDLQVRYSDFDTDNPPLIHQKEQLVLPDYPNYETFAKLSQQERKWGLLDDIKVIYDQRGWEQCLAEHCAALRGHRVVWRKDADPYRVKLIKSQMRSRLSN